MRKITKMVSVIILNLGTQETKEFELPMPEDELQEQLDSFLNGHDYEVVEADLDDEGLCEYLDNFDIYRLNELAEEYESLDDYDKRKVKALMEGYDYDLEEALECYQDAVFYEDSTMEGVARHLVDEGVFGDVSDNLKFYIDYEALANDLKMDGYVETGYGVIDHS